MQLMIFNCRLEFDTGSVTILLNEDVKVQHFDGIARLPGILKDGCTRCSVI